MGDVLRGGDFPSYPLSEVFRDLVPELDLSSE